MANTFLLKVITPGNDVYEGQVEKVFLKNSDGGIEILANHANIIVSTIPSVTKIIDSEGNSKEFFLSTAVATMNNGNMTICSDAAEFPNQIDFKRAEEAENRAKDKLNHTDQYDKARAELALRRACERLKLKK